MQQELYYEESVSSARGASEAKLYTIFKIFAILFFVVVAMGAFFAFRASTTLIELSRNPETGEVYTLARVFGFVTYFGILALFLGAGIACWFLKNRFNVGYDYTFVEDELRISKIYNGKRRKYLKSFQCDRMLKLGRCDTEGYRRTEAGLDRKSIRFYTPNREAAEGKEFFYFLYSSSLEKTLNIIEAKQEMAEYLVRAAGRNKWER